MQTSELMTSIEAERQRIIEKIEEIEERIERTDSHGSHSFLQIKRLMELREQLNKISCLLQKQVKA